MDLQKKRVWQQACGDTNRNYSKICLMWDVILNGPGYAGRLPEKNDKYISEGISSHKRTDLWRFSQKMEDGDVVVLRIGTSTVLAVGEIIGEYEWNDCFRDVDGWDLQHVRRVRWLWNGITSPKEFATYDLKQGDTTQELTGNNVLSWLNDLEIPDDRYKSEITELPKVGRFITQEEIAEYLFEEGVSSNSIEILTREFDELSRIAKWYSKKNQHPSEFETVSYLVVPLLRALGWTPQKMAIEWNKVDVALFDQLPREDINLSIVVEAKKKGSSCLSAISQAQGYAIGKDNCRRLIVSDGLRYGIYLKNDDDYILNAYFNLTDLRESYPIYKCHGIREALQIMTPEWRG
jgi:hypothetical protein